MKKKRLLIVSILFILLGITCYLGFGAPDTGVVVSDTFLRMDILIGALGLLSLLFLGCVWIEHKNRKFTQCTNTYSKPSKNIVSSGEIL